MGLVLLARFYERNEAFIVAGALGAAGVVVFIENAEQVGLQPFHEIAFGGFRLMVPEEDLLVALAVIDEARRHRSFEGERLSQRTFIASSLIFMFLFGFFLPFRTSKWHDVDSDGVGASERA